MPAAFCVSPNRVNAMQHRIPEHPQARTFEHPILIFELTLVQVMNSANIFTSQKPVNTRSSLACVPCRSRHLKCDGKRTCCGRCAEAGKQCHYAKSRRGGLDRAALTEQRKRLAAVADTLSIGASVRAASPQVLTERDQGQAYQFDGVNIQDSHSFFNGASVTNRISTTASPTTFSGDTYSIEDDALFDLYFKNFHKYHPLVLPQRYLIRLHKDPGRQSSLRPLIAVLRFIGDLYSSRKWSTTLEDQLKACFSQASPTDPAMVQCRLLYSIALFWHGYRTESKGEMHDAVRLALDLEMFRREFATDHGGGNPVLTESWRRTWWMLYIIHAYYAGTLGTKEFAVVDVEATVDLPCGESEYESGVRIDHSSVSPKLALPYIHHHCIP